MIEHWFYKIPLHDIFNVAKHTNHTAVSLYIGLIKRPGGWLKVYTFDIDEDDGICIS